MDLFYFPPRRSFSPEGNISSAVDSTHGVFHHRMGLGLQKTRELHTLYLEAVSRWSYMGSGVEQLGYIIRDGNMTITYQSAPIAASSPA